MALRFASTYRPYKHGAGTAPAGMIGAAIEGQVIEAVFSETAYSQLLDEFVYNRDVGRVVQVACPAAPLPSVTFNIGSTSADVVDAIASVDGVPVPNVTVSGDNDPDAVGSHLVMTHAGALDFINLYMSTGALHAATAIFLTQTRPPPAGRDR